MNQLPLFNNLENKAVLDLGTFVSTNFHSLNGHKVRRLSTTYLYSKNGDTTFSIKDSVKKKSSDFDACRQIQRFISQQISNSNESKSETFTFNQMVQKMREIEEMTAKAKENGVRRFEMSFLVRQSRKAQILASLTFFFGSSQQENEKKHNKNSNYSAIDDETDIYFQTNYLGSDAGFCRRSERNFKLELNDVKI